jgi:hypothetical protein
VAANDRGWLDAVALRDLVADGEVTPAEVAEGAIVRIENQVARPGRLLGLAALVVL